MTDTKTEGAPAAAADVKTDAAAAKPADPPISVHVLKFATYITKDSYEATWIKTKRNIDLVTYWRNAMFARMHDRYPHITGDSNSFDPTTGAQLQFLILVRMLYVSSIMGDLAKVAHPRDMAARFEPDSQAEYLWRWFAAVVGASGDAWDIQKETEIHDPVAAISASYEPHDVAGTGGAEIAQVAVEIVVAALCDLLVELRGAEIDCLERKKVTIDEVEFNGYLRLLGSRCARPVATSFFVDLFKCAKQLPDTKKKWVGKDKVAKAAKTAKAPKAPAKGK